MYFHFADIPEPVEKAATESPKSTTTPKTRRRRQAAPNSIEVENSENGKSTTTAPRAEESIQIVNENLDNLADRDSFVVFDGPLDPDSNYSGFVEVIGRFDDKFHSQNLLSNS